MDRASAEQSRALPELFSLALPTVAQMASYTLMQFIDTWMLSRLGNDSATAAGNSGMMALSVVGLGMGVLWIVNALVSQHFGAKDYGRCGRYLWQGIWFAIGYSVLAMLCLPGARRMFLAFGHSEGIAGLEATYFRILVCGTVLKLLGTVLGQFLLAVNRPRSVLVAALVGVGVNFGMALVLVLGMFGVKSWGIAGAAWAQNIGVACETAVALVIVFLPTVRRTFNTIDWRPRMREFGTLLRVGVPSGVQFIADILAWSIFCNYVMGLLGEQAMAANTFMLRYMTVSFMPAIGFSTAVTALVGRCIGAGRPEEAVRRANLGFAVTAVYMLACGAVFHLGRWQLMRVFTKDPEVLAIGAMYLSYAAVYQIFDAMYIIYNGALRGAGDTFWPAVATAGLCWGITVFGGSMVARHHLMGVGGPWMVATVYGIILGVYMFRRFRGGGWRQIRMEKGAGSNIGGNSVELAGD